LIRERKRARKWLLGVAGTPQEIASGRLFVVVTTGFPPNHAEMLVASAALVAPNNDTPCR